MLRPSVFFLALGMALGLGCSSTGKELNLESYSPAADQLLIAEYYKQEAAQLRRDAEELDARGEMYERMFGAESDWVSGTRLLAESYRHEAEDRERTALEHLAVARHPNTFVEQTRHQRAGKEAP